MDFSLTSDQDELRSLARQILTDVCTTEHLKNISTTETGTDLALWRTLGEAGLVGIGLPESVGGAGLGMIEISVVLEEIGRVAAPVPAFAVMGLAANSLVAYPDLLDGVANGDVIVTAAIHEQVGDAFHPATKVVDGKITGTKVCVPHGLIAKRFVVTAADGLYCVEASDPNVTITRQDTTSGVPDALVQFNGATAKCLGTSAAVHDLVNRGISAACLLTSGACQSALALMRTGDAYIDTEGVRLTAWHAAWRLSEGLDADAALLSAKFWAAEGGWRIMHGAHHVHGGVGVDRDYPLHRYFLLHKQLELQLGSTQPSLARLGNMLVNS